MYKIGLSVTHSDRTVVLVRDQVPLKIICETVDSDDDDPLPSTLLHTLLNSHSLKASDIESVSVAGPWRSPEIEESRFQQWLLPLKNLGRRIHRDWTFKTELKEWIEATLGDDVPIRFFAEDQCRAAFSLRKFPQQESFVLNLHSRPSEMGSTLWKVGPGDIKALAAFEEEESIEFFLTNIAAFSGYAGPNGLRNFLALAPMGEESFLDKFFEHVATVDQEGRLELEFDHLEEEPSLESRFDELSRMFGPARKSADSPVTVRELDMAATCLAVLRIHLSRLAKTLVKEQGNLPLIIQSESWTGDLLRTEMEKQNILVKVEWIKEREAVAEALGAVYSQMGEDINWKFSPASLQPLIYTQIFQERNSGY